MASTAIPIFPRTHPPSSSTTATPTTPSSRPPPSPSPSPSQAQAHLYSPTKPPRTQPNAHPYAIKTTSTALLSRSTSSSTNAQSTAHHYVPSSPSPSPTMSSSPSPTSPSRSPSLSRDGRDKEYQARATRHRYSRSLTSDMPMPLPPPPGTNTHASSAASAIAPSHSTPGLSNPYAYTHAQTQSANGHHDSLYRRSSISGGSGAENDLNEDETPRRKIRPHMHQRAETMPAPLPALPSHHTGSGSASSSLDGLPEDPKTWTSEHLALYVGSDANGNGSSMSKFVREKNLSGRAFLRLAETDLDSLPHATRASLLALSRGLRHKVVQAKIFGPNSHSLNQDDDDAALAYTHNTRNNDEDSTKHSPIGSLTRHHAIRPRRRSRVDSLSGASDSSVSSLSSDVGDGVGDTPRTNARRRVPVKERVDALEEKIGMMEEEGTASSSSASATGGHSATGAHDNIGGAANDSGAAKMRSKKSRIPQRGAVVSLFEQGPSTADSSSSGTNGYHPTTGEGNANITEATSTNDQGVARDAYLEDKDTTITQVARKNVNGKEPRMLPFPPVFPPAGQHLSHQHPLPQEPISAHHSQYHHPQYHGMSSPGPGAADSPAMSDDYYGYEFGVRRPKAFGSIPELGHPPRTNGNANNEQDDDPHAGVYVVRHHPSSPRIVSGSSPGGLISAHSTGTAAGDSSNGRKTSPRLLPYPPVVGRAVLHHPRPRRLVSVGAMDVGVGNETTGTVSDTGNEVWESALEDFGDGAREKEKDQEEELSVQELLLKEEASPEKKRTLPISGADAWEMEVGDTVKRVGDLSGSDGQKEGGKIMRLFEQRMGQGDGDDVRAREQEKEKEMQIRAEEIGKREDAVRVREDEMNAREGDVKAREEGAKTAEESLRAQEEDLKVQTENLRSRAEDLRVREESVGAREEGVKTLEEGVRFKRDDFDVRLREVEERERAVGLREEEVEKREVDVIRREEGVEKKEEELRQQEEKRENSYREDESIQTLLPLPTVDQAVATLNAATSTTNVDVGSQTQDSDISPTSSTTKATPYLISAWSVKRDWFLGRFRGLFAGARLGVVGLGAGAGASAGGALVLMSLGVCAVMLRVLARKVLGGAVAHAAAGGGRR